MSLLGHLDPLGEGKLERLEAMAAAMERVADKLEGASIRTERAAEKLAVAVERLDANL